MMRGKILITGGAGTLGQAIVKKAKLENWPCSFTIYSRDVYKHFAMRDKYPECRYLIGNINDREALTRAMAGHELVIHAAANKHIPDCENQPRQAYQTNVEGSLAVLDAAILAGVSQIVAISTDKVCHPVNVYGATKMIMERAFVAAAKSQYGKHVKITLCRYGNVLGSNGSVLQLWERQHKAGEPLTLTDPNMTRFWLTELDAVRLVEFTAQQPSGAISIPKVKGATMRELAQALYPDAPQKVIGLRPGEKMYEELLTKEESLFSRELENHFLLYPLTGKPTLVAPFSYNSNDCEQYTTEELKELVNG